MKNWKSIWEVKCSEGVWYYLENGTGMERKFSKENQFDRDFFVKWACRLNEEVEE